MAKSMGLTLAKFVTQSLVNELKRIRSERGF